MAPRYGRREDLLSMDISFDMERLFDPYNFDHIPRDKRLGLFKQRDLPHIKHYKAAVKIFGGPPRRTRAIEAPPMETPLKHRLGHYFHEPLSPPPAPILNGSLKKPKEPIKEISKEEKAKNADIEKTENYKSWIQKRQELRGNLNSIGLNEAMLSRKTDKTELERRVEAKFRAERTRKPETPPPVEKIPSPKPPPDVPTMTVPPPDGLQILDKFLSLNRMRLLDLFRISDKDKSWSLSRTEFLNAVSQSEIPLGESEVDDLYIALDSDLDDELSFVELNKGLMQWRKQRRDIKKQSIDEGKSIDGGNDGKRPVSSKESRGKSKSLQSGLTHKTTSRERGGKSSAGDKSLANSQSQTNQSEPKLSRERSSQDQRKSVDSKDKTSSERPELVKEKSQISNPADQSFDDAGQSLSAREHSFVKGEEREPSTHSRTVSQQHVQISESSDVLFSRENLTTGHEMNTALQSQDQADANIYEDVLFDSSYTPRPGDISQDTTIPIGEVDTESEKPSTKTQTSADKSASGQRKAGSPSSPSKSRTSTPNSLEPPEFDTRLEARVPDSIEAMVDLRKHDRGVLSRNTTRRNLSREQRVTFDELPGVIKVGYKAIDDHCSESTLGGEGATMVNQFRRTTLKEYFEVKKLFEENGLHFNQKTLDRVLLYPGDKPSSSLKKDIVIPLGPLTSENSPFNQPKPKKRVSKRRRGFPRMRRISGAQPMGGGAHSDDDRTGSGSSKRSFITVEDVYPFASSVAPKVYKENLSSGRALITRKVDSWMTFEEYSKYTEHIATRFQHFNRHSDPNAAWPGTLLDKLRLCMPPYEEFCDGRGDGIQNRDSRAYQGLGTGLYNGKGHAVFRSTAQNKLAYPGYNNDLLTWPVGKNGVHYANIDEHRLIK